MERRNYLSSFSTSPTTTLLIPFIITRESARFVAAAIGHKLYMVFPARVAPLPQLSLCLFCALFVAFLAQFGESFVSRLLLRVRVSPIRLAECVRVCRRLDSVTKLNRMDEGMECLRSCAEATTLAWRAGPECPEDAYGLRLKGERI